MLECFIYHLDCHCQIVEPLVQLKLINDIQSGIDGVVSLPGWAYSISIGYRPYYLYII